MRFETQYRQYDNVRDLDGAFFGDLIFRDIDVKRVSPELGLTYMNTMVFLRQADTKAQVQVEIRDGRYLQHLE